MGNYVVSAIKYRPQCFDDVVGQKTLTSTLIGAIRSGKLAHSYLFCGPRGVGKTTCARIFAKTINCEHLNSEGEACNDCDSCISFNEGRSLNVHEIDAASNNSVDNIRELIEQVHIPPQMGRYKVFIIDEVHMLSQGAFNAFLKTLEEPPSYAIFILATTEKQKIIPTILSRCQIYDFKRIEADDIVYQLAKIAQKENFAYEEDALRIIAEKADGGMRDALSLFDQQAVFTNGNITYPEVIKNLNVLDYSAYFNIYDSIIERNIPKALLGFNEISSRGFDGRDFIDGLARHTRNLMLASDDRTIPLLQMSKQIAEQYHAQAQKCNVKVLYRVMRLCSDCSLNYRNSRNKQLLVELTLIEAAQAGDDDSDSHAKVKQKALKPVFPTRKQDANYVAETSATYKKTDIKPKQTERVVQDAVHEGNSAPKSILNITSISNIKESGKNIPAETAKKVEEETYVTTEKEVTEKVPTNALNDALLQKAWLAYAETLPDTRNDLAARMKVMKPLLEEGAVKVVCENELVVKFMREISSDLKRFLCERFGRENISVDFVVDETEKSVVNPSEEFKKMIKESLALELLNDTMGFEMM